MVKVNEESLQKVTIRLFDGDFEKLSAFYPASGANMAIRLLVRKHLRVLEEAKNRELSTQPMEEIYVEGEPD